MQFMMKWIIGIKHIILLQLLLLTLIGENSLAWLPALSFSASFARSPVIPKNAKILILPGFGNDSSDYYLERAPQGSLVSSLVQRGWDLDTQIRVLPVQRSDWLQVFWKGIFDIQFWLGTAPPTRPAFKWYLDLIADCINELTTTNTTASVTGDNNNQKVILIGHSAGGWLARAALGYGCNGDNDYKFPACIDLNRIGGIVTLGSPNQHFPQVMDMTRGALTITSTNFPGAYHEELFYVTAIGDAVKGIKQEKKSPFEPTNVSGFAYESYKAVCGDGEVIGDGVVPVSAAHLAGAVQLNLDGVFHSINVPDRWYGSDSTIDSWHREMLDQFQIKCSRSKQQIALPNSFKSSFGSKLK